MNILKSLIRAIISLNQVNTFFYLYFFNIKYQLEMVNFNHISIAILHNQKSINFCLIFKPIYRFQNNSKKANSKRNKNQKNHYFFQFFDCIKLLKGLLHKHLSFYLYLICPLLLNYESIDISSFINLRLSRNLISFFNNLFLPDFAP